MRASSKFASLEEEEEEFGQPLPKNPRLGYEAPPPQFPHNQNHLLPPTNPMCRPREEELGQPIPKKPRLDSPHSQNHVPPPMNHRPPNGGLGSLFYKTRPCTMFTRGCCRHADNCTFAHGQSDLRKPPPNWRDQIAQSSQNGMVANTNAGLGHADVRVTHQKMQILKTKLCHNFRNTGHCSYEYGCIFAHGIAELRSNRVIVVESGRANVAAATAPIPYALMSGSLPMEPQTTFMEGIGEEEEVAAGQRWPKKMNGIYGDWPSYLMLRD